MGTGTRDLVLCGVILIGVAGAWVVVASHLPRPGARRAEVPPATNPGTRRHDVELGTENLRRLDDLTPPGEPAPPPPGVSPEELETHAA